MARQGLTEVQMAAEFGVVPSTVGEWKKRHPEFGAAMNEGRNLADARAESDLYSRVRGIAWEEKTWEQELNPKTEKYELVLKKVVTKFIPPDTTACIFWLKNRRPAEWRDTWRMEHTGKGGGPIKNEVAVDYSSLSDEELAKAVASEAERITRRAAGGDTAPPLSLEPPQSRVPKEE